MLGNWAIGKLRMVMEPTITKTMEITMATIGRLIKNFDIGLLSLAFHGKHLGIHLHSRTHLLYALGNHTFALLEPFRNNPLRTNAVANRHRSNAYFIVATHTAHSRAPTGRRSAPRARAAVGQGSTGSLVPGRVPPWVPAPPPQLLAGPAGVAGRPGAPDVSFGRCHRGLCRQVILHSFV